MLGESLLAHLKDKNVKIIVAYNSKIVSDDGEEPHNHEEADTLIQHQVIAASTPLQHLDTTASSPDTDVFTQLMDVVSRDRLPPRNSLKLVSGKQKRLVVDIRERGNALGKKKAQGLIGIHNFSGADWGGKLIGLSKNTWMKHYLQLDEDDPILDCFINLGEQTVPDKLVGGDLPPVVKPLEEITCRVYSESTQTAM